MIPLGDPTRTIETTIDCPCRSDCYIHPPTRDYGCYVRPAVATVRGAIQTILCPSHLCHVDCPVWSDSNPVAGNPYEAGGLDEGAGLDNLPPIDSTVSGMVHTSTVGCHCKTSRTSSSDMADNSVRQSYLYPLTGRKRGKNNHRKCKTNGLDSHVILLSTQTL
jgi:hypothetical protein